MSVPLRWPDMVTVGRIARVHGLRGQVIVNSETDFPESRFEPGAVVYLEGTETPQPLRVTTCRVQRGRPIVGFEGIDTIDDAEALAGAELRIPGEWLSPLPDGAYYVHDLVGCRVATVAGETLGTVERVEGDGGASRLVVAVATGEVLIPLAADICRVVNVPAKTIVVDPPVGLVDVNVARQRPDADRRRRGGR